MAHAKRNVFALFGWVVWKLLAVFGVKYAKDRLAAAPDEGRRARR